MNPSLAQMGVGCWIKYGGKCVWCVTFSYSIQSHNAQSPLAHHPGRGRFLFSIGASLSTELREFGKSVVCVMHTKRKAPKSNE